MKQLSKIMLAAVATVVFVMPAMAWDFGASGSAFSRWRNTTTNAGTVGAVDQIKNRFDSEGSKITLTSSNTDGANSASFSYSAGWNPDPGNFDESVSLSGSKTVGEWTASSSTSAYMTQDAGDADQQANSLAGKGLSQQSATSAAITLTNGSITYKLGDAGHLSSAEKAVNGPMGGAVDAEARVDSFNGFSVGLGVGPGTLTVAIDQNNHADQSAKAVAAKGTALGEGTLTIDCGSNNTGFGFNFSGDVGADLSFTYASGSASPDISSCLGDNKADAASSSTMGLGVAVPIGGMSLAIDYEATATSSTDNKTETTYGQSGYELSFTMPLSDATIGINISSQARSTKVGTGTASDASSAGTELWYSTPIGPVTLAVGYGSVGVTTGSTTKVTAVTSEMGAKMSMSF